ncbi:DUF6461 domain-containing protein [Actinomadura rudentiformis]|uniref:Uncharacterized protein n=1 Tax=Actinomadura rudentiformis TaxID=359158 RepID=A0A6H9Y8E1_9ACTN|nr:DUF6461 domain-containing protein [Actinomadura rudentiformis]KAB2340358.1 hypothetical protein F8566_45020 [Actinomadura rudentiformis]
MSDGAIAYYSRMLDEHALSEAACWTVIEPIGEPITIETVAQRLGAEPADIRERPWTAAYDEPGDVQVVHLAQAGAAVVMVEVNGFQGKAQIERLSEEARVHSAYWNVNAVSSLSCAAYGQLLVAFEGLFPDQRHGIDICALDEELDPLYVALHALHDDEGDSLWAVMMAIVERRTGIRFDEEWLSEDCPAILLPQTRRHRKAIEHGGFFDPELEAALWLASSTAYQAFTHDLVELLVEVGELADEPEIQPILECLAAEGPVGDQRYQPLEQFAARTGDDFENTSIAMPVRTSRTWRRMHAAWALQHALVPPAHTPRAVHSLLALRLILGDQWLPVRNRLRRHLLRTP